MFKYNNDSITVKIDKALVNVSRGSVLYLANSAVDVSPYKHVL